MLFSEQYRPVLRQHGLALRRHWHQDCLEERLRCLKNTCVFPQAQDSPWCSPELTTCCVIGGFCCPGAFSQHAGVSAYSCLGWENRDNLLCRHSAEHATPVTLRDVLASKHCLLGGKAGFVQLALSWGWQISSSWAHLPNVSLKPCITHLWICVLLSLPYGADMDLVWPASGSIWLKMLPSSMALSHPDQWHAEGRIIGGLTKFPWLGRVLLKQSSCLNGVAPLPVIPNTAQA